MSYYRKNSHNASGLDFCRFLRIMETSPENFKRAMMIGFLCESGFTIVNAICKLLDDNNKSRNKINEIIAKSEEQRRTSDNNTKNKIAEHQAANDDKMRYDDNHTTNELKIIEAKGKEERKNIYARVNAKEQMEQRKKEMQLSLTEQKEDIKKKKRLEREEACFKQRMQHKQELADAEAQKVRTDSTYSLFLSGMTTETWQDKFFKEYGNTIPYLPSKLQLIIDKCRESMKIPTLLSLMPIFAARCFSRVRLKYKYGGLISPTMLVIVVGEPGTGKSEIPRLYETIFADSIKHDKNCFASDDDNAHIIQDIAVEITPRKLFERIHQNQDVHNLLVESELDMLKRFHNNNGLGETFLRNVYDDGELSLDNMRSKNSSGKVQMHMCIVVSGTHGAMKRFFSKKAIDNGEAMRFCICEIDDYKSDITTIRNFDGTELIEVQNWIKDMSNQYCYTTDASGNDKACSITQIDMPFLYPILDGWMESMLERYIKTGKYSYKKAAKRIYMTAARMAMVLYMMAGCPQDAETQSNIMKTVVYLANYCMESYTYFFGNVDNELFREQLNLPDNTHRSSTTCKVHNLAPKKDVWPAQADSQCVLTIDDYSSIQTDNKTYSEEQIAEWSMLNKGKGADGKVHGLRKLSDAYKLRHHGEGPSHTTIRRLIEEYDKKHPSS